MEYHKQCNLERKVKGVKYCQISWIPEKFAIKGKHLELLENDVWENGWQVVGVGGRKKSKDVNFESQNYKRTRRASDI